MRYVQSAGVNLPADIAAHLLIEVDGNHTEELYRDAEAIAAIVQQYDIDEVLFADSHEQKQMLWTLRRKVGEAVKSNSIYKEEDTVVPRAELPKLLAGVKAIGAKYGFRSVCYGHAGDGNLHPTIVLDKDDGEALKRAENALAEIFALPKKFKGTITGEHGIGSAKLPYLRDQIGEVGIQLQRDLKRVFDPNGILNPNRLGS